MYVNAMLKKILERKFNELKKKNPAFSLRGFAKKIDIDHTTLSRILRSERQMTALVAEKLIKQLVLNCQEAEYVRDLVQSKSQNRRNKAWRKHIDIEEAKANVLREWYYGAIATLMLTEGFKLDPTWISSRLRISKETAKRALETMKLLDLYDVTPEGDVLVKQQNLKFEPEMISKEIVHGVQAQHLELVMERLKKLDTKGTFGNSSVFASTPEKMKDMQALLNEFSSDVMGMMEVGEKTEVYIAAVHVIPISYKTAGDKD